MYFLNLQHSTWAGNAARAIGQRSERPPKSTVPQKLRLHASQCGLRDIKISQQRMPFRNRRYTEKTSPREASEHARNALTDDLLLLRNRVGMQANEFSNRGSVCITKAGVSYFQHVGSTELFPRRLPDDSRSAWMYTPVEGMSTLGRRCKS